MYQQRLPYPYAPRYPYAAQRQQRLPPKEILWRQSWPYPCTLVLASLMLLLTIIIFILEISSLASDSSNTLSNTASTGAGIWCSVFFVIAVIFMYLLGNLRLILNNKNLSVFSTCL
jgi:hypothetical protein